MTTNRYTRLFQKIDAIVTESSVCSIQLAEGTGIPVYHPLQLRGRPLTRLGY